MNKRLLIPTLLEQLETDNFTDIEDYSRGIYSATNAITIAITKILTTDEPHRETLLKELVIEATELLTAMAQYPKDDIYNALIMVENHKDKELRSFFYAILENQIQQERKKQSEK